MFRCIRVKEVTTCAIIIIPFQQRLEGKSANERVCWVYYSIRGVWIKTETCQWTQLFCTRGLRYMICPPLCFARIQTTMASPVTPRWMCGTWGWASSSASPLLLLLEEHLSTIYQITGEFSALLLFLSVLRRWRSKHVSHNEGFCV